MPTIRDLSGEEREQAVHRILRAFVEFCRIEWKLESYDYQLQISRASLASLFVTPGDVFIKLSRQSGKTETVTLLLRFLLIFYGRVALSAECGSPERDSVVDGRSGVCLGHCHTVDA